MKVFAKRSFCPVCGARIAWLRDGEAEIMLGSLDDAPTGIVPEHELWTGRREEWMPPLPGRNSSIVIARTLRRPMISYPASPVDCR